MNDKKDKKNTNKEFEEKLNAIIDSDDEDEMIDAMSDDLLDSDENSGLKKE